MRCPKCNYTGAWVHSDTYICGNLDCDVWHFTPDEFCENNVWYKVVDASKHEPEPVEGDLDIITLVMLDFNKRAEAGKEHYGTYLQSHNGRDALMDAYQEAIDLCMYLRQMLAERDGK